MRPTERTYVMGGWYNGDPSIRDNKHHGLDWSMEGRYSPLGKLDTKSTGFRATKGCSATTRPGSGTTTADTPTLTPSRAPTPPKPVGGTGASMACSTKCWFDSANPAATVVSASPARSWSLPTNPSVRCLSSPQPASSSAAFSSRDRRTWAALAWFSATSAMTCKTLSGALAAVGAAV